LNHHIDEERFAEVLSRLEYRAAHAILCVMHLRLVSPLSGIDDAKRRVGHRPNGAAAESLALDGSSSGVRHSRARCFRRESDLREPSRDIMCGRVCVRWCVRLVHPERRIFDLRLPGESTSATSEAWPAI